MQKKIIIDYLNFTTAFYLIKNERNSIVIAIFKSESRLMEFILVRLLNIFVISYSLEKMNMAKLSINPTSGIYKSTGKLAIMLANQYCQSSSTSKVNHLFNHIIKSWFFSNLWRTVSVVEYVSIYYKDVDAIYVSTSLNNNLLKKHSAGHFGSSLHSTIHYYSAFGLINDENYSYRRIKPKFRLLGERISQLIKLLYKIFYISIRSKISKEKFEVLLFSHDHDERVWLGINKIPDYLNLNCRISYPNQIVGKGHNKFKIKSITWPKIIQYYGHTLLGLSKFSWSFNVSWSLCINLLNAWQCIFILENLYHDYGVKMVLSGGYESIMSQVAVALASDNHEMISFETTASLGEYPTEFVGSWHKFSDRFFLWGSWHHDLSRASKDKSSGYIIAGYIFDNNISKMKEKADFFKSDVSKKYNKIITIFDTSIDNDHAYAGDIIFRYIDTVVKIAEEFNALVVLKTKKNHSGYSNLMKSNDGGQLLIHYEKGSLVSALVSDVVVGLGSSTPAVLSAVYSRKVVLFEPTKIVWSQWGMDNHDNPMVTSLTDLQIVIRELLLSDNKDKKTLCSNRFDPYADGKSQYRIAKYIECVFENLYRGKIEALIQADTQYKVRWGEDKVFLSEELNH